MNYTYKSFSSDDTLNFAKNLASKLQKKDVIVLTGELGSGKTKFVEGILSYFNLEDEISSPTFTIVNEYKTTKFPIFHFDVYRLSDVSEFYEIGGEEYFENGICLIEWGARLVLLDVILRWQRGEALYHLQQHRLLTVLQG